MPFTSGVIMVGVILFSRKCNINPDNVATPIAASLGDLTTLGLLAWIASVLYASKSKSIRFAQKIKLNIKHYEGNILIMLLDSKE